MVQVRRLSEQDFSQITLNKCSLTQTSDRVHGCVPVNALTDLSSTCLADPVLSVGAVSLPPVLSCK